MSEKPTKSNQKSNNLTNFTNKFKGMLTIIDFNCLKRCRKNKY